MTVAFAQLLIAMAILMKIGGTGGFLRIPFIAGGLILLATAILILTGAVKNLSGLNWQELPSSNIDHQQESEAPLRGSKDPYR